MKIPKFYLSKAFLFKSVSLMLLFLVAAFLRTQKKNLKSKHKNLQKYYQNKKNHFQIWKEFKKKYAYDQAFSAVQKVFKDSLEHFQIKTAEMTVGQTEVVLKESHKVLYKTVVVLSVSVKNDYFLWQFFKKCSSRFLGHLRICEISLDKLDCLGEPDILNNTNLMIKGEYRFEWYHLGP
ncbi:MAG: hypothetical protein BGO07_04145 [Alphaproteobacteria bacterium 40-19]|nr:MAG: hypothetical protein BGO07_04145 [Alphaproteobacteria bacterium 40-19]